MSKSKDLTFKLYGYTEAGLEADSPSPLQLSEVTLSATPASLRAIAGFLMSAAEGIEKHGTDWEHEHLCDQAKGFNDAPSLVVYNISLETSSRS